MYSYGQKACHVHGLIPDPRNPGHSRPLRAPQDNDLQSFWRSKEASLNRFGVGQQPAYHVLR